MGGWRDRLVPEPVRRLADSDLGQAVLVLWAIAIGGIAMVIALGLQPSLPHVAMMFVALVGATIAVVRGEET